MKECEGCWFCRGVEEYLSKLHTENEDRARERFKRLKEKYPDAQGMIRVSKEDFEKIYPGVEY